MGHLQMITSSPDVKYNHNTGTNSHTQLESGVNTRDPSCLCLENEVSLNLIKKKNMDSGFGRLLHPGFINTYLKQLFLF